MNKARKERTEQARKVLADTHIVRPILVGIKRAIGTKRGNLQKRNPRAQEEQELIEQYTADIEALQRVGDLLEAMNGKAFEALRYDLRRDIAADIAGHYFEEAADAD